MDGWMDARVRMHACMHVGMLRSMHVHMYIIRFAHMYKYTCVYSCVHMHAYTHIHTFPALLTSLFFFARLMLKSRTYAGNCLGAMEHP